MNPPDEGEIRSFINRSIHLSVRWTKKPIKGVLTAIICSYAVTVHSEDGIFAVAIKDILAISAMEGRHE